MISIIKKITCILVVTLLISCTKEISVDVAHEPKTIIYGQLNNGSDSVVINIQQSVPLNSTATHLSVNDATVMVYTKNTSGVTSLVSDSFDVSNGTYTSNSPITTQIGNKYWIEVALSNGTLFKSEEEILKPVITINDVSLNNEDVLSITFSDPENDINFYKFDVKLYNNGMLVSTNQYQSNDVVFNGNDEASVEIDLFKETDEDTDDEISQIVFDEITITLYNINLSSYQFYLNQSQQLEANLASDSGGPDQLFATPPVSLLGNITNIGTNKIELGNFTIQSKSTVNQQQ